MKDILRTLKWVTRSFGSGVVAFGGVFLATAAIVSLPRLREVDKPSSDVNADALRQSLEGLKITDAQLARYYADDLESDPLDINNRTPKSTAGSAALSSEPTPIAPSPAGQTEAQGTDPRLDALRQRDQMRQQAIRDADEFSLDFHTRWKDLVAGANHLRQAILDYEDQEAKNAVSRFHLQNIERQGSREEREQFLAVQTWFTGAVTVGKDQVRTCTDALGLSRPDFQSWALLARMARTVAGGSTSDSVEVERFHHELNDRTKWLTDKVPTLKAACFIPRWPLAPSPVPLGQSLGPMRWVAGWLLDIDSLPLALIVGTFGFGLLGSLISTFIRVAPPEKSTLSFDSMRLSGVVLRGLSAAIIVFLAFQGGLAVLSGSDSSANPYVVLLACFVAAVFSEPVWSFAYKYFNRELDRGLHDGGSVGGTSGSAPPKGPPGNVPSSAGGAGTGHPGA